MEQGLKEWVEAAARRADVCAAVDAVYADLQREIDVRRPICIVSGRCCRFEEFGHRLYVTTMELAAFTSGAPDTNGRDLLQNPGGCPFQTRKMCGVHAIRPFGCRVFFCDATSDDWQKEMYERFHARLKSLHEEFGVPYAYVEWRSALENLADFVPFARERTYKGGRD